VDAARADQEVIAPRRRHEVLSGELRGAVDAEGPRGIVLAVGLRGRAVEDVVGRVMDEERAGFA
jgi:hypothetical protein